MKLSLIIVLATVLAFLFSPSLRRSTSDMVTEAAAAAYEAATGKPAIGIAIDAGVADLDHLSQELDTLVAGLPTLEEQVTELEKLADDYRWEAKQCLAQQQGAEALLQQPGDALRLGDGAVARGEVEEDLARFRASVGRYAQLADKLERDARARRVQLETAPEDVAGRRADIAVRLVHLEFARREAEWALNQRRWSDNLAALNVRTGVWARNTQPALARDYTRQDSASVPVAGGGR